MLFKRNLKNLDKDRIRIHFYDDPSTRHLDVEELSRYVTEKTSFRKPDVRRPLVEGKKISKNDLARKFAKSRVRNLGKTKEDFEPLYGEIRFEENLIENPGKNISGILYDGFLLTKIFRDLISANERNYFHIHIIFTNRLFGTWDDNDRRYHARVSVYGFPTIISTSGIVEAPAKPKEFYRKKRELASLGNTSGAIDRAKKNFEGRFVEYNDNRLMEIMKGYAMQAVFYHLTSNPFCEKKYCRLYNAHWQEEVLRAQLESPEFCESHKKMIENLKSY